LMISKKGGGKRKKESGVPLKLRHLSSLGAFMPPTLLTMHMFENLYDLLHNTRISLHSSRMDIKKETFPSNTYVASSFNIG
jgi:hypothetical protein